MPTKIDSTIGTLTGPLTSAAKKKGAQTIAKWEADLEKAEWTGAKTIHADLGKLRRHLEDGQTDGAALADLLVKLGESTERAAKQAKGSASGKLEGLGQALVKAGEGLRG
ncbi:hypothetical protein E7T06_11285 [Deinococcus sp. Arct2-2]|uniref:hypothetical protein n=1 Tax=Deinococcus sp. Arct2-2 TaxID=2568653 RepID=UPI0010A3DF6D|nr:hypothetical protein [Deinococcus sp. Arct2-2]THF69593.1 hypothetical protein E7T06_11285 [Deinococcus sp. Arct2-2]